jgi:hypothetical protein
MALDSTSICPQVVNNLAWWGYPKDDRGRRVWRGLKDDVSCELHLTDVEYHRLKLSLNKIENGPNPDSLNNCIRKDLLHVKHYSQCEKCAKQFITNTNIEKHNARKHGHNCAENWSTVWENFTTVLDGLVCLSVLDNIPFTKINSQERPEMVHLDSAVGRDVKLLGKTMLKIQNMFQKL